MGDANREGEPADSVAELLYISPWACGARVCPLLELPRRAAPSEGNRDCNQAHSRPECLTLVTQLM